MADLNEVRKAERTITAFLEEHHIEYVSFHLYNCLWSAMMPTLKANGEMQGIERESLVDAAVALQDTELYKRLMADHPERYQ